jgi:hypothetical protein
MTDEQRRAIAIARARQTQAAQAQSPTPPAGADRFGRGMDAPLFDVSTLTEPQPQNARGGAVMDVVRSGVSGLGRGATELAALPATIGGGLDALSERVGLIPEGSRANTPSLGAGIRAAGSQITNGATEYDPQTTTGEYAQTVGEFVGGGAGAKVGVLGGLASEGAGQLTEGTALEPYARIGGGFAGGFAGAALGSTIDRVRQGGLRAAFVRNTESVDDLRTAATSLYDDARATGVQAAPAQTTAMATRARATLQAEGAITPSGRIAEMPNVRHAIATLDDYAGSPMTPTEMLSVRRALQTAAGSADGAEARIGRVLRNQFDEAINPLAPQIRQANAIYGRMAQGELVEQTIELAGSQAGQFTGSGFENALRTQFRGLERKIIKGQLQASPDEVAMISHIARGGSLENLMRDIGKAAPTGVVSLGMGAGVPFVMGNAIGGPALGAAAAVAVPTVGAGARNIATRLQTGNADFLGAIARSGGKAPAGLLGNSPFSLTRDVLAPPIPGLLAQEPQR